MEVIEGSHEEFHSDSWLHIESLKTTPIDIVDADYETETAIDFGAVLDKDIFEAKQQAEALDSKNEDPTFALATGQYLTALQRSYRDLQVSAPHLSSDLLKNIGEARACRELCSIGAGQDKLTSVDTKAIELAAGNVNWNAIPIAEADALFDSITGTFKASEDSIMSKEDPWMALSDSPVHILLDKVPVKKMQELFLHTDDEGGLSSFARYIDAPATSDNQLVQNARFFLLATKPQRGLEDMKHHPVIDRLIDRLGGADAAKIIDGQVDIIGLPIFKSPEKGGDTSPEFIDRHNARYERGIQEYLVSNLGLSRELISSVSDALKSRLKDPVNTDPTKQDDDTTPPSTSADLVYQQYRVLPAMLRIGENVRSVGAESIQRLHKELGVVNIDRYSPEDLQTMVKLLDNDPDTIENLQNGDVMTIMSDTYGDWNGAFNKSLDNVRRDSGRSLLFEVAKPSDFYRHMIFLKKRGIKPSSLSINAHGLPGLTHFGASTLGNGFYLAAGWLDENKDEEANKKDLNVSLNEASLPRLFSDEFFQPSRGIDDAADWFGATQVIINSCSSDVANEEWTRSTAETIATRIAKTEHTSTFSVIGASDVLYVESTPEGLRFTNKDNEGIGVKLEAKIIKPTRRKKILAALSGQQAEAKLSIQRTSYAVIPVGNTFRKAA